MFYKLRIILEHQWRELIFNYRRFVVQFASTIRLLSKVLEVVTWIVAMLCITTLIVYVGYEHNPTHVAITKSIMHSVQLTFIINVIFNLALKFQETIRETRFIKWVVDVLLLLTFVPWFFSPSHNFVSQAIHSNYFLYLALGTYSAVELCYGIMKMMGRRTNPTLLLAGSFTLLIFIGSIVLMMPRCTHHGISYIDSLFVSTSAVCITGLCPVDIPTTFTTIGQIVLSVLFQIGGLGIITFTSFFALFFSGNQSIYSQLLVKDMIYSKSMNSLLPTLLYILTFTIIVELIGAVAVYFTLPENLHLDFESKIGVAIFHSMSAFCNVGFSNLPNGMANSALMNGNQSIYIVMSILLFAGGIGYPILVNVKDIVVQYAKRFWRIITHQPKRTMPVHIYDFNTKLVLYTTTIILIIGSLTFFVLESSNTMAGMSVYKRAVQSVFNSLIPRSGGYASLNPGDFMNVTLLLIMVQMWIGGSSQSMAGGVKVNTIGVIILNLRSIIEQKQGITAFHRNIATPSVRRANAVVTLSLISTLVFAVILMLLEPNLPMRSVIFEVVSAVFSVGSSLGITNDLCTASRGVLCIAMFLGRVGLLSLLTGMFTARHDSSPHYPSENVIIN
jgi:Trk-type K+ transport system membrane component